MIFINGQFVNLSFVGENMEKENIDEKSMIMKLVKYTISVHSEKFVKIDMSF